MFESKNNVNSCRLNVRNEGYAEVLILKMIYISKFRKDIKPLKIKFRKTIRNGARIYTPVINKNSNCHSLILNQPKQKSILEKYFIYLYFIYFTIVKHK